MKKNYFIGLLFFFTLLVFSQYVGMFVSFFETRVNTELKSETNPQYAFLTKNEPADIVEFNYFYNEVAEYFIEDKKVGTKKQSYIDKASLFLNIICTSDISVSNDLGICGAVVNYTPPSTDVLSATMVQIDGTGLSDGSFFPLGDTVLIYQEQIGGASTGNPNCTFNVTVTDNEAPVLSGCPSNITQVNDATNCSAVITWTEPTATDNCTASGSLTWNKSHLPGATFPVGTTAVTYTATDAAGNTSLVCTFNVTVTDNEAPTASNPLRVTVECIDEIPVDIGVVTDEADNCTLNPIVTHVSDVSNGNTCPEIITRTYNISDGNGNSINVTQTITINDITKPTFTKPADITIFKTADCTYDASLSFTGDVTNEDDNCATNIEATFTDVIDDSNVGKSIITRTWSLVDDCGNNADDQIQIIIAEDNIDPVAICQPLTVNVDDIFTAAQINNGSTDNCGIEIYSLDRTSFDCSEVGDHTVTLTVTDFNGNTDTCETTVTVLPTVIDGGSLTGHNYFSNGDPEGPEGTLVNVTACPENEIKNVHMTITGSDGVVSTWEYSYDGGAIWNDVKANPTNFTFINAEKTEINYLDVLKTTLIRVKINVGSCVGYSPTMLVQVIPPDVKPATDFSTVYICMGDEIVVNASSEYANNILLDEGGLFNQANPEDWRVNYILGEKEIKFPASADNEVVSIWAETNGPKDFGNLTYDTSDNTKFAIAFGDFRGEKYGSITWNETWTTMETAIFDSTGLEELFLVFDQAYYLESGAYIKIEISTDGGVTYPNELDPTDPKFTFNYVTGVDHDYTGPSTSGAGTHNGGFVHTKIDLTDDYLGQANLRVRFTFEGGGTTGSAWAIDNISVPDKHVDEIIEWTDEFGNIITYGFTANIEPVSPGYQHIGATSLIDQCRSADDIGTQRIEVYVDYAYAGKDLVSDNSANGECGETSVILNAYDNEKSSNENKLDDAWDDNSVYKLSDIPGSVYEGMSGTFEGTWTAVPNLTCAASTLLDFSFSDIHDPKATFTGEAGDYTLTWTTVRSYTDSNGDEVQKVCNDDVNVTITNCEGINFDGTNDYVDFKTSNYNFTNQDFSIEAWVRTDARNSAQIQTIFSKRNANNLTGSGYDLRITSDIVSFNWASGGNIKSPHVIGNDRWYHIAVTFDGGTYKLYIDGIEVASKPGQALITTSFDCMLGAMDDVDGSTPKGKAKNFLNGSIDELRIWNLALNENQIRETMNQEINDDGSGGVIGAIVPIVIDGLNWGDLEGYYRMDEECGFLIPTSGVINGKLRNINDDQITNAPIPYTSNTLVNGQNWNTDNTWTHFNVWDPPNSLGVDGITRIDWNIAEISTDIISREAGGFDGITLLGLVQYSGKLTVAANGVLDENNTGRMLWITHYLKLDGIIDLVGESQLIQKKYGDYDVNDYLVTTQFYESALDATSSGYIERDQQGIGNLYRYNDWSSPVGIIGQPQTTEYAVKDVLRDGFDSSNPKTITFIGGNDGVNSSPIQIAEKWIYGNDNYNSWVRLNSTGTMSPAEGFSMKGTHPPIAAAYDKQNFVFMGKPHNGDIELPLTSGSWYLTGNPFPSALDAYQFIDDNAGVIDGTIEIWDDWEDNTHLYSEAHAGYAKLTKAGGIPAVNYNILTESGGKTPGRYIAVAQGFGVTGIGVAGSKIKFRNAQRKFVREGSAASVFFKSSNAKQQNNTNTYLDTRLKIRLGFKNENNFNRQILLTIDNNTTDNIDYGYDAVNNNVLPNDLYWVVDNDKLIIQAVKNVSIERVVPIGISAKGNIPIKIKVDAVENPYPNMEIYLRDNLTMDTYDILNGVFEITLEDGEYSNKYSMVFKAKPLIPIEIEEKFDELSVFVAENGSIINVRKPEELQIKNILLFNVIGQQLKMWESNLNENEIELPVHASAGVYVILISTNEGKISKKIIIK